MSSLKSMVVRHDEALVKALNIKYNHKGLYPWVNRLTMTMDPLPGLVITAALLIYLFTSKNWDTGYRFIGFYFATEVLIQTLKVFFNRSRPFKALEQVIFNLPIPRDPHSFPSGHTASAVVIALVLGWLFPAFRMVFYLYPVFIGLSRIYLGYHYPTDVLAGGAIPLLLSTFFS
jgi:undecaprenyl-diphosphatase